MTATTETKPTVLSKAGKARKKVEQGPRYVILFRVSVGQSFYRVLRNISTVNNGDLIELKPGMFSQILDCSIPIPFQGIPRILGSQVIPFINGVKASLSEDYFYGSNPDAATINLNDCSNILIARYEANREDRLPVYVVSLDEFEEREAELE